MSFCKKMPRWIAGLLSVIVVEAHVANAQVVTPAERANSFFRQSSPSAFYLDEEGGGGADAELSTDEKINLLWEAEQARIKEAEEAAKAEAEAKAEEEAAACLGEDVSGQKWSHRWGGRLMGDYVNWMDDSQIGAVGVNGQDYFEFRRMRLFVDGKGYGVYDYKFQLDFEPEGANPNDGDDAVSMKDMYIGIDHLPNLGYVRFGHFKAPFSLEELTSSKYITFMERALPNVFSPGREVGVAAYRAYADDRITIGNGIFFDDISEAEKERVDDNQGVRVASRATFLPYYDESSDGRFMMHTGMSYTFVRPQDRFAANSGRFRARPEIHEGPRLISTGNIVATDWSTYGGEFAVVHGPASLQSEVMYTSIDEAGGTTTELWGGYIYASYFLTGEHRAYKRGRAASYFDRVTPFTNFWLVDTCDGPDLGWGAWELGARWSMLNFTDAPNNNKLHDLTFGVNWYWNPYTRMMFNWIIPMTDGGPFGDTTSQILGMRLQYDF